MEEAVRISTHILGILKSIRIRPILVVEEFLINFLGRLITETQELMEQQP
jgi:hypothetical protein